MPQHYKLKTHAGPFARDQVVTEDDIKAAGGDPADWEKVGAVTKADGPRSPDADPLALGDTPRMKTDAANKADVERRIREEVSRRGELLPRHQQQQIADDVTNQNRPADRLSGEAQQAERQDRDARLDRPAAAESPRQTPADRAAGPSGATTNADATADRADADDDAKARKGKGK
jgi:hypothetical protein